ncbi:MAG: glycosyltransferase, partial [Candidatus Micrarchaeaceae archaeon]
MNINRYNEFSIIIPTLNEEKGAVILIKKIIRLYKNMKIIVVDDGSIDNTASNIKKLSQKYKQILFINRGKFNIKKGLTGSIIHGILVSNTKYVIVIDADLQHPFQKIKNIIELLNNSNDDNDLVVGVRANVINWKLHRKIISRILMSIGSFILIITNKERCNDIFSGFFGIKRKL